MSTVLVFAGRRNPWRHPKHSHSRRPRLEVESDIRSRCGRLNERAAVVVVSRGEARFEVTSLDMTLLWRQVPFSIEPYTRTSHSAYQMLAPKPQSARERRGRRGASPCARASYWAAAPRRVVARLDLDRGHGDVTFTLAGGICI